MTKSDNAKQPPRVRREFMQCMNTDTFNTILVTYLIANIRVNVLVMEFFHLHGNTNNRPYL